MQNVLRSQIKRLDTWQIRPATICFIGEAIIFGHAEQGNPHTRGQESITESRYQIADNR
jgi:hypothetical protein